MVPMLSSQAFSELIRQLQGIFDVVVIDSMAVADAADAVVLHQEADAVVLVTNRKRSTLKGVAQLTRQIATDRIAGVVFNEWS